MHCAVSVLKGKVLDVSTDREVGGKVGSNVQGMMILQYTEKYKTVRHFYNAYKRLFNNSEADIYFLNIFQCHSTSSHRFISYIHYDKKKEKQHTPL